MTKIWPTADQAMHHAAHHAVAPLVWDPGSHLVSRFTFGPTAANRAYLVKHTVESWWQGQVTAGRQYSGYRGHAAVAAQGPLLSKSPSEVRAWLKAHGGEYGWEAMDQLSRVTLGLQVWSKAQLYETLVDFFSNHLNVANHNGDVWNTRHAYDRDVIRKFAFGRFSDMLVASSKHPAMLVYLNLAESNKSAVNENYGRELLELHTVGLGYSESDVKNSARALTGRTLYGDHRYVYDPDLHWTGPIRVLGFSHANVSATGGESVGDAYVRYLATHPKTAAHIARKLCQRFVSDNPSNALVSAVANAYLKNHTEILPTVHTILRSEEFWMTRGRKVRRPVENLIATIRVLGNPVSDMGKALDTLDWMSQSLGQRPLDWAPPNGYPDVAAAWRSSGTLINLWSFHRGFAQNWWDGFGKIKAESLYGSAKPKNSGQAIVALTKRLTGMTFSASHRAALQKFLAEPASTPLAKSNLQWYLPHLIPLILDAPHHALR
ncbi:DUF1800 domain-containing protein [Jatrophihabitans telluris]|uniref:DUF1800 domain-containing protein n=1 Tax=Jatrophihabitans telluris TaxID=2038343 RepID=A0ABY4R1G2_9ACTN|nr:DUF1800 domain-containing protein [Jatrophihabitans telluris]UQX89674.1 DUF1800 domain-containing protein [Jatrophihabitans telluris]